jgi:hypothetical protein
MGTEYTTLQINICVMLRLLNPDLGPHVLSQYLVELESTQACILINSVVSVPHGFLFHLVRNGVQV